MAKGGGVRIDGLNQVIRDLLAIGLEVEDLKGAFSAVAARGARLAAAYAPRRSGRLAGDIRGNRARSKAVITAGRAALPYAGPINYGWAARNIAPSGFMQKADLALQPFAAKQLDNEITKQIRKRGLT